MENKDLQKIVADAEASLATVSSKPSWEQAKATFLGPNGCLTQFAKGIASVAKDIAKELNMSRAEVMAVIETLPLYIAKEMAQGKLVIFDHFGSFRPMYYCTNGKANLTYRVKFKPSETLRKMLRKMALKDHPDTKEGNKPNNPVPDYRKK